MWRFWFQHIAGVETYVDVEASSLWGACDRAHAAMRDRAGSLRGWWPDRWQPLTVWAGVEPPSRRRRLVLAWRRALRRRSA